MTGMTRHQIIASYYAEREAQDIRFEDATGGGISASDKHTQEFRDYFGVGDSCGRPVEERITYKRYIQMMKAMQEQEPVEYDYAAYAA